jgi:hypothetical protein
MGMKLTFYAILLLLLAVLSGCVSPSSPTDETAATTPAQRKTAKPVKTRQESLPAGAVKVTPEADLSPPVLHSADYFEPVPLSAVINTAGGEDSPFVTDDGSALYFFFTPDVNVPAEKQLLDGVTGIWVSHQAGDQWSPAQRVVLEDEDELALDGAEYVRGDEIWFASARVGGYRTIDIWIADFINGEWANRRNAGEKLNKEYQIGEFHLTADGNALYFHADRAGGKGGVDIWVTRKVNGEWQEPENVAAVNSAELDGWPCISPDGKELWFTRTYLGTPAIFLSRQTEGKWGPPEMIISQFAGEPSLDAVGNLYFVHHFYRDGKMIEADIYVAYRKQ